MFAQSVDGVGNCITYCHLGYESVYLPLHKVADTPFHIQGGDVLVLKHEYCLR